MHENVLVQESRPATIPGAVFSIFIPTWNNLPYLKLCVGSIIKNSSFPHEIIVHINEGSDGTLEWVREQAHLSYTHSAKNIGVCYALNQCRTMATSSYFLYLNDDMYVCPGWDARLQDEIQAIDGDGFFISATAIEPRETGNDCVIVEDYGSDPESFQEERLLETFSRLQKADWQGSTWPPNVVHRKTWDLVGGYSIEYSPGLYSDPDFSMKLWQAGIRLFKGVGSSRVYHFGGKSTARIVRNAGYYAFISKWGMSARSFTKLFLRSGKAFNGPLHTPQLSGSAKLKNMFKRLQTSFKS